MVNVAAVKRIAAALPETEDLSTASELRFAVRGKQFAWSWLERTEPKGPRHPRLDVLVVRCPAEEKEAILSSDPEKFFTEEHYRGFPAVLVRLGKVSANEVRGLLTAAWRCQAPRTLVKAMMEK